jgi:cytidylate kinase
MSKPSQPSRADLNKLIERQVRRWDNIAAVLRQKPVEKSLAAASQRPPLTISGSPGSGRVQAALALCEALDYDLFGREIMDAVAEDLDCQRLLLDSLDERVQSQIELMVSSWLRGRQIDHQEYLASLLRVMGSLADRGGVVILGRCGAFFLGEKAGLRIRLEAPVEVRVRRIMESREISEKDAREFIETAGSQQSQFCRRFLNRDVADPLAYDLVLNTGSLSPEDTVPLVETALHLRGLTVSRASHDNAEENPS